MGDVLHLPPPSEKEPGLYIHSADLSGHTDRFALWAKIAAGAAYALGIEIKMYNPGGRFQVECNALREPITMADFEGKGDG